MSTETPSAGASPAANTAADPHTIPAVTIPAPSQPNNEAEKTPAPPAADPAEQEKADPGQPPAEAEDGQQKPKSRFQERIDKITAEKYEWENRAKSLAKRVRELEKPLPEPEGDLSYDQQDARRLKQVVREERADELRVEAEDAAEKAARERLRLFEEKAKAASDRMPDLLDKFTKVPVSDFAADFIAESEKSAEIAYWLGSNPDEAKRIARLPLTKQAIELARLEGRLQAAPQVRKTSQAPSPPQVVNGAAAAGSKSYSEMSMEEYAAEYRERQKRKGGR